MREARTLSRRESTDPDCPECGAHWDEATTVAGDIVRGDPDSRWWTLPCGCRVVLRVSQLQYPRDTT